jgi:ribosome-binding protein aMBF1 (putative translation factor)
MYMTNDRKPRASRTLRRPADRIKAKVRGRYPWIGLQVLSDNAEIVVDGATAATVKVRMDRESLSKLIAQAEPVVDSDALPALPTPDAEGNVDAIAYGRASIAREIIRRRKAAGLSQAELATRARVRQETISRVETAKHVPDTATLRKIDDALRDYR